MNSYCICFLDLAMMQTTWSVQSVQTAMHSTFAFTGQVLWSMFDLYTSDVNDVYDVYVSYVAASVQQSWKSQHQRKDCANA